MTGNVRRGVRWLRRPVRAACVPLRPLFAAVAAGSVVGAVITPAAVRVLSSMAVAEPSGWASALALATAAVILTTTSAAVPALRRAMKAPPSELLRSE